MKHPISKLFICYYFLALAGSVVFFTISSCTARPYWDQESPSSNPTSTLSTGDAPVSTIGWQEYTVVGTVNIRREPDTSSEVIGALYAGAVVKADCDRADGFCEVPGGFVVSACLGMGDGKCQSK